jgi:hypothetical protein
MKVQLLVVKNLKLSKLFTTDASKKLISVNWKCKDGSIKSTVAEIGESFLKVAHKNGIELEGACEGC